MLLYLNKIPKEISQKEFEREVRSICDDKEIRIANPNWLMLCMWAESNLKLITNGIGAYGFIQITKSTAEKDLGIFMEDLQSLDWKGYMSYVRQYLKNRVKENGIAENAYELYALIHYPVAYKKTDSYILYVRGSKAYSGNSALDFNKDGKVTWAEVKSFLDSKTPAFYDKSQLLKPEVKAQNYYYANYKISEISVAIILVIVVMLIGWWWIPNNIFFNLKNRLKNGNLRIWKAQRA
jgi:hypothetical protein